MTGRRTPLPSEQDFYDIIDEIDRLFSALRAALPIKASEELHAPPTGPPTGDAEPTADASERSYTFGAELPMSELVLSLRRAGLKSVRQVQRAGEYSVAASQVRFWFWGEASQTVVNFTGEIVLSVSKVGPASITGPEDR